jgi:ferredoxin-NADP reductase
MDKVLEGSYENKTFMTCGPTALMNMVVKHLTSNGVEEKHIKQESFE